MIILIHLFLMVLAVLLLLIFRTIQLNHSPDQKLFEKGTLPSNLNGFSKGNVFPSNFGWKGKIFDSNTNLGINLFRIGQKQKEQFPFETYAAKGLTDKNLDVLAIDYNIPQNFFLLHLILDELVQVEPNKYLGKLQLKIIPSYPFTLIFFRLEQ